MTDTLHEREVPCEVSRCPVCQGMGVVPNGFYGQTSRSCGELGIVLERRVDTAKEAAFAEGELHGITQRAIAEARLEEHDEQKEGKS